MGAVWVLPVSVGLVLPLWADGPPVEVALWLVLAGSLLKAREVHAERPGAWFPLLVTGSTTLAFALSGRSAHGWGFRVGSSALPLWHFLLGLAVAVGLGFWAWRARSPVGAVTAVGYLTAVWHFLPTSAGTYPEVVIVAGAVLAFARLDRVRPWHVVVIAALLGSLWHQGAVALLLVAVVLAAYDLNADRPGAWFPLLLTGIGLVSWTVLEGWTAPRWSTPVTDPGPATGGSQLTLTTVSMEATAVSHSSVDYDELFLAFVVAVGLAAWSRRRRSPVMLLTGAAHLAAAWFFAGPVGAGFVVLAGAAVAFATTAAPGAARTAGRWAGTPGRRPGP